MTTELANNIELYQTQGLSFFPLPFKSKEAVISWKEYQYRKPTEEEISQWSTNGEYNIAVVCGKISDNLVILDCDSTDRFYQLSSTVIEKTGIDDLLDFTSVSQTSRGFHIWLKVKEPVKSAKFPNLDIKAEGGYVVAPPSIHPSGFQYRFINDTPINNIDSLKDIGIDIEQKPMGSSNNQPGWVSQLLTGVGEGQRNDAASKLAGYFRNLMPQDITERILLDWNAKNTPPMPEGELVNTIASVYRLPEHKPLNSITYGNTINIKNISKETGVFSENSLTGGQVSGQVVDKLERGYGELAEPFDQFLRENPEPHWKREVAEIIGTNYKDGSFIKLVQRRNNDGDIRVISGGDKIQWVNREWQKSMVQLNSTQSNFTNLCLPFGGEKYIAVPEHSQIVVAGDIGSGKTHWGYLLAELNAGKMPIRHFFNEIGSSKAKRNLEDFPNLLKHYGNDYYLIDLDLEGLDIVDNLDPNGLNIYDYLHLTASKEWFLVLQRDLTRLSQKLEKGVICVMLQKKRGTNQAMGGDSTRMQCEIYITLNIEQNLDNNKECRVDIEKAKDWVTTTNPETLCCKYKTMPKWGKLEKAGEWQKKPQDK